MLHRTKFALLSWLATIALTLTFGQSAASAQALRHPRLEKGLQALEVARTYLDVSARSSPPELREGSREALGRVDVAIRELHTEFEVSHAQRQLEPARAERTDHPLRASREALQRAIAEMTRDIKESDIQGHNRIVLDQSRAALEVSDRLARREEVLLTPPPAPVVEIRHPRLQHAVQFLEVARDTLSMAEQRAPRETREEAHIAREDVNAAVHEVMESLAAAGVQRVSEVRRAAPTDRPLHAAQEELKRALDELQAVTGTDFRGHERRAIDRTRMALEEVEKISSRE